MGVVFLVMLLFVLFLTGLASHFLSTKLYRYLVRTGNSRAKTIRVVVFIFSFLIIFFAIALLIINNVRIGR